MFSHVAHKGNQRKGSFTGFAGSGILAGLVLYVSVFCVLPVNAMPVKITLYADAANSILQSLLTQQH